MSFTLTNDLRQRTWYLSGPMSGYENYNYPVFEAVTKALRIHGFSIESPHENAWPQDRLDADALWRYMMDLCLEQMDRCQGIILLRGWVQSRGAKAELEVALQKGWPVLYYSDKLGLIDMNKEG